jgi:SAM-dependent methyltransferase
LPDEFTGERVVPGEVDPDLFNEHFSRYVFARRFAQHKQVLDLGCGTGYGTAALAEVADQATGVDSAPEAVAYARAHFACPNLKFEIGHAAETGRGLFGLITAFEVIEHLEDWRGLLTAARAQLSEDGVFIVSTPNKPVYAEARGAAGDNPFHVHEFAYPEFQSIVQDAFPHVAMFVQSHSAGILFARVGAPQPIESETGLQEVEPSQAHFFVAVCSRQPLAESANFFWLASSANLLRDRDRHIALLTGELALKTQWIAEGREELRTRNGEYEELLSLHRQLKAELETRNSWALEQNETLRQRGQRIEQLQTELEVSQAEWALAAAAYEQHSAHLEQSNRGITEWAHETERRLTEEVRHRSADLARAVELLDTAERTVEERTLWAQGLDRDLQEWQARFTALRHSTWVRAGSRLRLVVDRP